GAPASAPGPARHRKRRVALKRTLLVALALVVLGALAGGWVAWRATQARTDLRAAATLVGTLQQQLKDRDVSAARATLTDLQRRTGAARGETSDPVWSAAGALPAVGDDVHAVRALAAAVDELSRTALPGLVDAAQALDPKQLTPSGGQIALAPIVKAAPAVIAGDAEVRTIAVRVAALDKPGLIGPVRDAVRTLSTKLADAQLATASAVRAVTLLPPMLGANGPRTYLLVFQNLAEVRGTGGIWGAWATVRADNGRLSMEQQGSAGDINAKAGNVPLDPDLARLYTDRMGTYFQDVNMTADFPTAAKIAREMFRLAYGQTVDGVLATDPVALSYLLRGAPPVALAGNSTLTAANAVQLLLNQIYLNVPDPKQQDLMFAAAARGVFTAVSSGAGNATNTIDGVRRAAAERRIFLWSASASEQAEIDRTTVAGSVTGPSSSVVSLFLNDGTGSKMDYYVHQSVDVVTRDCTGDTPNLSVTMTLQSTAPSTPLPDYVTGAGTYGVPPGTVRTNVTVLAPLDGSVTQARIDGQPADIGTGLDNGRQASLVTVDLPPGAHRSVTFDVLVSAADLRATVPLVGVAPGIGTTPVHASGCAAAAVTP
ncbi:MAG: hypothetical protein QOF57_2792, partial [Frankiaceae bacterium]|nr:hypothetical protein [Frankiaceae bacterium]